MAEQICEIGDIGGIDEHLDYPVVVVGAGVAGMYQIKRLAELGACATVVDATRTWVEPGTTIDTSVRDSTQRATPAFPFSRCEEKSERRRCD